MRRPKKIDVGPILAEPIRGKVVKTCRVVVDDGEDLYVVEVVKENDETWVLDSMWIGDDLVIRGGYRGGSGRRYALAGPVHRAVAAREAEHRG